ncbi:hypothetical protein D9758_015992 [Tetrapyrgos nigripes]|uniref:Uncharacterized protein n=1 Tax=Tetrapyrgos nigripes TaxID=182062 RepID=A0A8H5FB22_9AGAR|nr:hypothetical protein D9758_015992 [Tetrapyrgos nigripes]
MMVKCQEPHERVRNVSVDIEPVGGERGMSLSSSVEVKAETSGSGIGNAKAHWKALRDVNNMPIDAGFDDYHYDSENDSDGR